MLAEPTVIAWVNREAEKLEAGGRGPGSPREDKLIDHWRIYRPKMVAAWEAAGPEMLEKLAFVLDLMRYRTKEQYIQGGMPIPDAEEEATKDWLIMEPEDETPNRRPRLLDLTSS